ncbi:EutP/PduV family microcompartment system protein [Enterococcus xiangfangensis]|uniref:EutP/PduV family microcompartment system protein n=1 Tax=Enterococcus xiangfangensis TaxID=1296537 RepID=UPI003D185603|nr:hypothetical protein [Enterococcus asini]
MKKLLLVGPKDSGKMTIANFLEGREESPLKKVASIVYHQKTIIVPDSYLESPWMHKHIIALQQSATSILFLQPVTAKRRSYPPNFAKVFRIPIYGLVTYHQSYTANALQQAQGQLMACGLKKVDLILDLSSENDKKKIQQLF